MLGPAGLGGGSSMCHCGVITHSSFAYTCVHSVPNVLPSHRLSRYRVCESRLNANCFAYNVPSPHADGLTHYDNRPFPSKSLPSRPSMSFYLLAGFIAISAIYVVLHSRESKSIKHVRGPPSPSFLFGEQDSLLWSLTNTNLQYVRS